MKSKNIEKAICAFLSLAMLCGCGAKATGTDPAETTEAVTETEKPEPTPAETEIATEEESEPETEENTEIEEDTTPPELILTRQNAFDWGEGNIPRIRHQFSTLSLGKEYASDHKELESALEKAKDEILAKEQAAFESDLSTLEENESYTFDESWMTYLRRSDSQFISFVNEYCSEGLFDDGYYTEYIAHTYDTKSGKEIALSDVVADEDALFNMMGGKMHEYIEYAMLNIYAAESAPDEETVIKDLREYMQAGALAWTLDPEGITFYLNAYTALPAGISQTVLFEEDKTHTIFNEEFAKSAVDEWIMQTPSITGSYVDLDDSGVPVYVRCGEEYDGLDEELYISGLGISCDGDYESFSAIQQGGTSFYDVFLVHKDHATVLLENHREYKDALMSTYSLGGSSIEVIDSTRACFEPVEGGFSEQDDLTPYYIPTDAAKIRTLAADPDQTDEWEEDVMRVDAEGHLSFESGRALQSAEPEPVRDTSNNMSDSELKAMEKKLNSIEYYGFLHSDFHDPTGIWWDEVFYVGAGMDPWTGFPPEDVQEAFLKETGDEEIYTDLTAVSGEDVKAFVQKTTGLDYSEMKHPLDWTYLKDYDLYIHEHGDTNQSMVEVTAGHFEDGEYTITYTQNYIYDAAEYYYVTFVEEGDSLRFISNLPKR